MVDDGYEFFCERSFVTIFSAPDYCEQFDNNAAVLICNDNMECSFEILQPVNRFSLDQPKMKVFLQECCKFEELFPFKKVEIKDLWVSLEEVCFRSLHP